MLRRFASGLSGESSAYEVGHRNVDDDFGSVGWVSWSRARRWWCISRPEGRSTTRRRGLEPFDAGAALDDFGIDSEAGAVVDGVRPVAGAGPHLGRSRGCCGDLGERMDAANVVADTRRGHLDGP